MSGLPDIGVFIAQVGDSRLGWPVSKHEAAPSFETPRIARLLRMRRIGALVRLSRMTAAMIWLAP